MMTKARAKGDDSQNKRFIEKARELGCDEDPKAFERAFSKVAPPKKPKSQAKPEKKPCG